MRRHSETPQKWNFIPKLIAMVRNTHNLSNGSPRWVKWCCRFVLLAALAPVALSLSAVQGWADAPSGAQLVNGSHAIRESGRLTLPLDALQHLGRHIAYESEENRESEVESHAPILCTLPTVRLQNTPVISRIGAVSEQARVSVLLSLALPMLC